MAETAPAHKDSLGFLTRKVGPFPIWVYALAAVAAYYWYTHYGPGAQKAAGATAGADGAGRESTDLADVNQQLEELRRQDQLEDKEDDRDKDDDRDKGTGGKPPPRHRPPMKIGVFHVGPAERISLDQVSAKLRGAGNPHATAAELVTETNQKNRSDPWRDYRAKGAYNKPLPHGTAIYYQEGK